jgi:hypothetical protein
MSDNHPATAPNYHFTAAAPSSRVAPTQIAEPPQQGTRIVTWSTLPYFDLIHTAQTQPDGRTYAAEPEVMTQSESGSSGAKVPFKEQVMGTVSGLLTVND